MRRLLRLGFVVCGLSCGNGFVPSPFDDSAAGLADAGAGQADASGADAGSAAPDFDHIPSEVLGGPCVDDAQCEDGIDCTFGACDLELGLCRFTADDSRCADDLFCNGVERCHPLLGCQPGPPTTCEDSTPCTIDRCDEATRSCVRTARDVDQDGDVDGNCAPGGDCDDNDPRVSSLLPEMCGNGIDDDCDGEIDEADCQLPEFDTCAAPLAITGPGSYLLSPAGAVLDYGASCTAGGAGLRELVLSVTVPVGPAADIDLLAQSGTGQLALARVSTCGQPNAEVECLSGTQLAGESVARLRLRGLSAGVYSVYLLTDASAPIQLEVNQTVPGAPPDNRACDTRLPLVAGEPAVADLVFAGEPLESACPTSQGDLFYEFSVATASDALIFADSVAGLGMPRLSLRRADCQELATELTCTQRTNAFLRGRALEPGTYVVAVSATAPTDVAVTLELRPPSSAPPGDQCTGAPSAALNETEVLSFVDLVDDIAAGCNPGFVDTARSLSLEGPSDVLLLGRFSSGDVGSVALSRAGCRVDDTSSCADEGSVPARLSQRGVAAGDYRVVVESLYGLPATLTTLVRPAVPPTLVPGADNCDDALAIGAEGGFFQGTTVNAGNDFSASCDFATPSGAPEQLLRFQLEQPRRVVFDMQGSDFETLLNVRRGPACPGEEVVGGCSVVGGERSYLDLDLPAGDYFVQVDGYAGAFGNWFLDVFVLPP